MTNRKKLMRNEWSTEFGESQLRSGDGTVCRAGVVALHAIVQAAALVLVLSAHHEAATQTQQKHAAPRSELAGQLGRHERMRAAQSSAAVSNTARQRQRKEQRR